MTTSDLASVYTTAATHLRRLARTGEPLHPRVLQALAQYLDGYAHNAEHDHLNIGDWAGFDYPGQAHDNYDLAALIKDHHP